MNYQHKLKTKKFLSIYPLLIFGKVSGMIVIPEGLLAESNQLQEWGIIGLMGLALTTILAVWVTLGMKRRTFWERQVQNRTVDLRKTSENLHERVKEMQCLVELSQLSQQTELTKEEFLQKSVELLPPAWHYPESTCARLFYQGQVYLTENFTTTPWRLSADLVINNCTLGRVEVYLTEELSFLKEEEVLINTVAQFLSRFLESEQTEELLKESLHNYQSIFNSTNEALFIYEIVTKRIIDVNESMLAMYGYGSKEEVLGLEIRDFSANESIYTKKQAQEYINKTIQEGCQVFEWLAKKANGDQFWVEVSLKSTEIGGQQCILAVARDINERKLQEQKIQYLSRLYATLSQINQTIITHKDRDSLFTSICEVAVQVGQFPLVWVGLIEVDSHKIVPFAQAGHTTEYLNNIHITILDEPAGRGPTGVSAREARLVICEDILHDPRMLPWRSLALKYGYQSSAAVPLKQEGRVIGVLTLYSGEAGFFTTQEQGLLQEISDNISFALDAIQAAQRLQENEERLRLALKGANQGLYDLNIQTGEALVSPEYALMLGYDPALFHETNANWIERLHPDDQESVSAAYRAYIKGEIPLYQVEFRQLTATGEWKWILSLGKIIQWDEQGQPLRMLGTHTDITERKQAAAKIEQLAYYDPLTNLPNRRLLFDRIDNALALAKRAGHYGALLFIDLDRFKTLNDARGHDAGDRLLKEVGDRLQRCLRQADTVGRFGGDEFLVLLPELADNQEMAARLGLQIAEKIRRQLSASFFLNQEEVIMGASIGVTLFPKATESLNDLVKEADTAMFQAKASGRNSVRLFETKMQIEVESRFALEGEIRQALEQKQFRVFLQAQVDAEGSVVGAEALIRWQHPTCGLVPPIKFIPVAEETGLIVPMGEWVLQESCHYLAHQQAIGRLFDLSVNVSPRQFRQPTFVQRLQEILLATRINPRHLTLEVTEGLIIEDSQSAIATMQELQNLGLRFSIDDFGTGYSSLAYLKRLPLHELKIDKSFVQDAPHNSNDAGLVEAIIAVAHHFNLKIVAEGVETVEQADFLKVRGCIFYQGYLYGRPIPMSEFHFY
jgi:diguanylate cyclase (GGDEF)-like protein/PAS domain S-box-containing protein